MGGNHSSSFNVPPIDPQFKDIGCIGLKKTDYSGRLDEKNIFGSVPQISGDILSQSPASSNDILAAPPFLWYRFTASNYQDILDKIAAKFASFSPEIAKYAPPPVNTPSFSSNTYETFTNPYSDLRKYILKKKYLVYINGN